MKQQFRAIRSTMVGAILMSVMLAGLPVGMANAQDRTDRPRLVVASADAQATALGERQPGSIFRDCEQCPEMVVVPAGSFLMGDPDRDDDKHQVHEVTIAEPLAVGVYEVTRGEFGRFVKATGYSTGNSCWTYEHDTIKNRSGHHWRKPGFPQREQHPVVCVSWEDAQQYVSWLSQATGQRYRLLSEAEWEYVARAGTTTKYWWGNQADHDYANYGRDEGECCGGRAMGADHWKYTSPVGSFKANAFGLYDTTGNVWEWVEDCWNESYRDAPADGSAWTSGKCNLRVMRGAAWGNGLGILHAASRRRIVTSVRNHSLGFRVARTLTQ